MKQELQDKLFEKYPKIFRQRGLAPQQSCMCWGIETPDGWYDILDNLCRGIQSYVDSKGIDQVEAAQVKEKWGGLRFYYDNGDSHVDEMVRVAEALSTLVCANCGSRKIVGFNRQKKVCEPCKEILDSFI